MDLTCLSLKWVDPFIRYVFMPEYLISDMQLEANTHGPASPGRGMSVTRGLTKGPPIDAFDAEHGRLIRRFAMTRRTNTY